MNLEVSSTIRQIMERQIKANLAVVYRNALPHVLDTEVSMVESKAFATATSRGSYLVNVMSYIEIHKKRTDGARHVQRIPKFTHQEENARRARVQQSINAGDEELAQEASNRHHATNNAPNSPPISTGISSSPQPSQIHSHSSNPSPGIPSAQPAQTSEVGVPSNRRFSRSILPQGRSFSQRKIDSQRTGPMKQKVRNAGAIHKRKAKSLHAVQSNNRKPSSAYPQSQSTTARQMGGSNVPKPQTIGSRAPRKPETRIALKSRGSSSEEKAGHLIRPQVVNKECTNSRPKPRFQQSIVECTNQPQAVLPSNANTLHHSQPSCSRRATDHVQTIEKTQNISQTNNSRQNTNRSPVQPRLQNQALPGRNLVISLPNDLQTQIFVRNQPVSEASKVPQVEPVPQPQLPQEMITDEVPERPSSDEIRSLIRKASDPFRCNLEAADGQQNGNAKTLSEHTPSDSCFQPSTFLHNSQGSGFLPQQYELQRAPVRKKRPPMNSTDDKKKDNAHSTGVSNERVLPQHDASRGQGLSIMQTGNRAQPLHVDNKSGMGCSVQESTAAHTNGTPESALKQQVISNTSSRTRPGPKQHGESSAINIARAALQVDDVKGKSKNSSEITPTQQRVTRKVVEHSEASSHANPELTAELDEVIRNMPKQSSRIPMPSGRKRQALLDRWATFQRDYRARLDRIFPILEILFANPTDDEKRMLKNILIVRTVLHKTTPNIVGSSTENSSYDIYLTFVRRVFRKYSKYEHMPRAELEMEARSLKRSSWETLSGHSLSRNSQATLKSLPDSTVDSGNPAPTVNVGRQALSSQRKLEGAAERSVDMSLFSNQNPLPANCKRPDVRHLPGSHRTKLCDPKRVQAIVQQHVRRNVEKKIRDCIARSVQHGVKSEQKELKSQSVNDHAELANEQGTIAVRTIENPAPVPNSLLASRDILENTKATIPNSAGRNVLAMDPVPITLGNATKINSPTDNQMEKCRNPIHGDNGFYPCHADVRETPVLQNEDKVAEWVNRETSFANTGKDEENGVTSKAEDILERIQQAICRFQKAVDEGPILNGSVKVNENDTRTDDEALSVLQDILDGSTSRNRSARVEETLKDLECSGKETDDSERLHLEPASKKRKSLSLREQVDMECEHIQKYNDSAKCLIQEENDALIVTCDIHMRDEIIPILKMKVRKGYPMQGTVQYYLETPPSGWLPSFVVMRSRFEKSMSSESEDFSLEDLVGKWFTAVVQTVLTFD